MNYFSQTGNTLVNTRQNQSTSPVIEKKEGVIFSKPNNVVYPDKSKPVNSFSGFRDNTKVELTKEEEDKFYKKVFKTSLI